MAWRHSDLGDARGDVTTRIEFAIGDEIHGVGMVYL
jgi:hypothetical protein